MFTNQNRRSQASANRPPRCQELHRGAGCARQTLLDAAAFLFLTRGLHRATMRGIARRAGCSVGHIYHHFGSKRDLVRAVVAAEVGALEEGLRETRGLLELGPTDRLRRQIDVLCDRVRERPGLLSLLRSKELDPERLTSSFRERVIAENAALFQAAQAAGEIGEGDPRQLAAAHFGIITHLLNQVQRSRSPERYRSLPAFVDRLFFSPLRAGRDSVPRHSRSPRSIR